jgi:hypothetical protein
LISLDLNIIRLNPLLPLPGDSITPHFAMHVPAIKSITLATSLTIGCVKLLTHSQLPHAWTESRIQRSSSSNPYEAVPW